MGQQRSTTLSKPHSNAHNGDRLASAPRQQHAPPRRHLCRSRHEGRHRNVSVGPFGGHAYWPNAGGQQRGVFARQHLAKVIDDACREHSMGLEPRCSTAATRRTDTAIADIAAYTAREMVARRRLASCALGVFDLPWENLFAVVAVWSGPRTRKQRRAGMISNQLKHRKQTLRVV